MKGSTMTKRWQYAYIHEYLALLKAAARALAQGKRIQLRWNGDAMDAEEWQRERIRALDRRIALKGGEPSGRKHSQQYQTALLRDCQRVRQALARVRVYQFETPEITARYKHLLADPRD